MRKRPLTKPMRQAWARVRIHLNLGDVEAATSAAREASALTEWERFGRPQVCLGPGVVFSAELPAGWCWFEPAHARVLFPQAAMDEFGFGQRVYEFAQAIQHMPGPAFRRYDTSSWRQLWMWDAAAWQAAQADD